MVLPNQGTGLKRGPPTIDDEDSELGKKPRWDDAGDVSSFRHTPLKGNTHLPSPMTRDESTTKDGTISPPVVTPSLDHPLMSPNHNDGSPSQPPAGSQTQPFSQMIYPPPPFAYEVDDEEAEAVWGYLVPIDGKSNRFGTLVLRERQTCAPKSQCSSNGKSSLSKSNKSKASDKKGEKSKEGESPSKGYLIGRHPECDLVIDVITVSNRHCLIFSEMKKGQTMAIVEDTSGNGTFVNDGLVGRNNRRELLDGDELSILDEARFCFRYPRHRSSSAFKQQYAIQDQLGRGHFATVYLAVDQATGSRWAVKKFERTKEKSRLDGLQQEIAVLMSVNHPALLCLKGAFDEEDGVYIILELAAKGELFNWIVKKQKLTEAETRRVFVQLFQAVKYLHERNIVHRDIKPENILLTDDNLTIKLADFGLAKIIGEESFTTTLCGTPSYVAPEILQPTVRRRYTKAVDVWSLGVVLYICLCGFPPFSDELYTPENPYTLPQQILGGRYDFPSPYWDTVGDPALDLIDRMLTTDPEQRITVEECLEHPWTTGTEMGPSESMVSTDGLLAGRMGALGVSRRGVARERTLLSELNNVQVAKVIETDKNKKKRPDVVVFSKNDPPPPNAKGVESGASAGAQKNGKADDGVGMSGTRFLATGNFDDSQLFGEDGSSRYAETRPKLL